MKTLLAAFLLLASADSARAQLKAPASAWKAPISRAAAGLAGRPGFLNLLAATTLPKLAAPAKDGSVPLAESPALLEAFAAELEAMTLTPESFASLSERRQGDAFGSAFFAAREQAARKIEEAAAAAETLRDASAGRTAAALASAEALAPLLLPSRAAALPAARARFEEFEKGRLARLAEFRARLPQRLASGEINPHTLTRRDEDGWYAADDEPGVRHPTLNALYAARLERLGRRVGPWTAKEVLLLGRRLNYRDAAWLDRAEPSSSRLVRAALDSLGERAAAKGPRIDRAAIRAIDEKTAGAREILASEDAMAAAAAAAASDQDHATLARVLAAVKTGGSGWPSWDSLKAARRERLQALGMGKFVGVLGGLASVYTALLSALMPAGLALFSAALFFVVAAVCFGWALWQLAEQQSLEDANSELRRLMAERFPKAGI